MSVTWILSSLSIEISFLIFLESLKTLKNLWFKKCQLTVLAIKTYPIHRKAVKAQAHFELKWKQKKDFIQGTKSCYKF